MGALLDASPLEQEDAAQDVIAIMCEESLNIAADNNNIVSVYELKPMIESVMFLLKQKYDMTKDFNQKDDYETAIVILKELIEDYC